MDVKLPEVERYKSATAAKDAFLHILPKLTGYAVSFYAVGAFWMKHLRIFSFLKDYSLQLITINLLFLFSVSLFPFALSFFFNSAQVMQYTWGVFTYVSIYQLTNFTQTMLIGYLIKNKEELCYRTGEIEHILHWKVKKLDYFAAPVVALLIACTIYFDLDARTSYYIVFAPIIVYNVVTQKLKKYYYPHHKEERVTFLSLFGRIKSAQPAVHKNSVAPAHHTKQKATK